MIDTREFLNCLAFRVFCSGQFIRHHNSLEFTTEPDLIHEFVGHVPMFADPLVAVLSFLFRISLRRLASYPLGQVTRISKSWDSPTFAQLSLACVCKMRIGKHMELELHLALLT